MAITRREWMVGRPEAATTLGTLGRQRAGQERQRSRLSHQVSRRNGHTKGRLSRTICRRFDADIEKRRQRRAEGAVIRASQMM